MASFNVEWRPSTKKDLRKIPPQDVARIVDDVKALSENPLRHGSQKLAGAECVYRVRVGDYRVVYEVDLDSRIIVVLRVRHRKDVYRS